MKSLVNNITALNQKVYLQNLKNIESKPYRSYFKKDMYINNDIIRLVQSGPIDKTLITKPTSKDFNQMLKGNLWETTGYNILDDGTLYCASRTKFPGCSSEMFEWWFWWHAIESERYTLWYPYCHLSIEAKNKDVLKNTALSNREKYIGNTHIITEYLNDAKNDIEITFIDPKELGFNEQTLKNANITASACGHVYSKSPKTKVCTMLHLFKETEDGGELISRYYLGHQMATAIGKLQIKFPAFLKRHLLKSNGSSLQMAYEQVMHDQIEFTHLASFLPKLFNEFGK